MFPSHGDSVLSCARSPFPCISAPRLGAGEYYISRDLSLCSRSSHGDGSSARSLQRAVPWSWRGHGLP